jgi:folate-dependent phosphoribosylglycinamide formyltransferase PurN
MTFRIVILTNGHLHGLRILNGLNAQNITPDHIVFSRRGMIWHDYALRGKLIRPLYTFLITPLRIIDYYLSSLFLDRSAIISKKKIVYSGELNSQQLVQDLRDLKPDFIILGGMGIVSEQIIHTAKYGVINTHPGLLPWCRNVGVVGRALERRVPIGVTAHYVNNGIDTGRIIRRHLLPITGTEMTLDDIERKAQILSSEVMVHIVADIILKEDIPKGYEQTGNYPKCTWMSKAEREAINVKIQEGLAYELFLKWQDYCEGPDKTILPPSFQDKIDRSK